MILKDIVTYVSRGITPKYIDNDGFCVLNQKCIRNHNIDLSYSRLTILNDIQLKSAKMLRDFDILINSTGQGTLGRVSQIMHVNNPTTVDSHITILRVDDKLVNPRYVGYFLKHKETEIELLAEGSTGQTELSKDKLINSFILPDINMSEQQHIVDTIGSVDDLIEKTQEKLEKLIDYSMAIFCKYETQNEANFVDVFECFNGGTFKSKDYIDNSRYKLITIKNIDDNGFNSNKTSFLKDSIIEDRYLLKLGDILLTMTGNIGRVGIVDDENCYLNQRVLKIISGSQLYLFCYLTKYKKDIILLGKGTAQQNLSLQDLYELKVNNSKEEVYEFKKFDYIFDLMLKYKLQIRKLKREKELLLKKYFG